MALCLPIFFLVVNPLRSYSLLTLDRIFSITFNQSQYAYALKTPPESTIFTVKSDAILNFAKNYSFFSSHPLVSNVTQDPSDLHLTLQLLEGIDKDIEDPLQKELIVHEVLAKVLAYRDLSLGQEISIPCAQGLVPFLVDCVFDLGSGMPAYGLLPTVSGVAPILLFRGTDFSISSGRGVASIISDIDPKGPGLSAFFEARPHIHAWLVAHPKPKLVGCSLGGALAIYTYLYERPWINTVESSSIFNPPGVATKIYRLWEGLAPSDQSSLNVYVTRGDLIPKIGKLLGNLYQLSTPHRLYPIAAHVTLITAEPQYTQSSIDLTSENLTRRFSR